MKRGKNQNLEMPFLEHLEELRWRILKSLAAVVVAAGTAFPLSGRILDILTLPNDRLPDPARLIFLKPAGMLMLRMEIAVVAGLTAALPVVLYQLWQFIAPGLLPRERRLFPPLLFSTIFCFALGAAFAYGVMIPAILPFLYGMGTDSIEAVINVNEYASFLMRLILLTGLVFELPVAAFFLARIGLVTPALLRRIRKYSIVSIFVLSAVVTPTPDPLNQILLAVPLLILYEISIVVAAVAYRRRLSGESETAGPENRKKPRTRPAGKPKSKPEP
ncbi:MAG: twin-arginine translocase subunit TatC [bacterium]|nr:twin-arginine translocase subunit TatC [bacterium]